MRAASILLALLLSPPIVRAEAPTVDTFRLDAGTEVALVEDHRTPAIAVVIEFPVGTWSPWGRQAFAAEAFDLQRFDPGGRLRAEGDRLAADVRTSSDERSARLTMSCLKEDLDEAIALARRILTNRDIDASEAKRRKRTQDIEWKTSQKQPYFVGIRESMRTLFAPDDPRRQAYEKPAPTTGDVARLVATRDTTVRLPGRVVGFAGDLTRADVERLAAGLLPPADASPPANLAPVFLPLVPEARRKDATATLPRLTQVYFAYGRESISFTDPDYPAFVVANHVLGGHFYSRLYVALRHEGGETYGARAQSLGDVVIGPVGLATFTRTSNAAATEAKLREVLRVFHENGITEQERADAVGYLLGQRLQTRQSPGQILWRYLTERRLGLDPGFLDGVADRAASLPLEEINAFIARFYDPAHFSMVKVAPKD